MDTFRLHRPPPMLRTRTDPDELDASDSTWQQWRCECGRWGDKPEEADPK